MPQTILPIADQEARGRAAELVRAGKPVIFPTDTFYALGVDPFNERALAALYRLKERPGDQPVLLLVPDASWAGRLWASIDEATRDLMERFWPGPLTIVAPPGPGAPGVPPGRGLALRVPGNPLTRELLAVTGPLTGTSANPAGRPPARTAAQAAAYFPGVALVLDGGTYDGGAGSTLVEVTPAGPVIIREGLISAGALRRSGT